MLFDTHAHMMSPDFQADWPEVLARTLANTALVMNIGCNLRAARIAVQMAEEYPSFYAAIGLHPNDVRNETPALWAEMCQLAQHEKVRAVGETGLDYYWKDVTPEIQKQLFVKHIELAHQIGKPLVIHDRDAHRDCLDVLWANDAQEIGGVFHAYSGSVDMLQEVLEMNFYISLGGPVTFKNARIPKEVAKAVPLDRLLIETDCPYLTPTPYRGKRNEPMYVRHVAEEIAALRGISYEAVVQATYDNGCRLFQITTSA